jgi:hypothetical protein
MRHEAIPCRREQLPTTTKYTASQTKQKLSGVKVKQLILSHLKKKHGEE